MALRLRFLLDTNVLIPLQDSMAVLEPNLANFVRLCNAHGYQLLYHRASLDDIKRDPDSARRDKTLIRLRQYTLLQEGPTCPWNSSGTSANDASDNEILYALECDAAHALVTEDHGLHKKARARGLGDRVYYIQSANDWVERLHEPEEIHLPNIIDSELHTLTDQLSSSFFDSLRAGYNGFDEWFRKKARAGRSAWIYRDGDGQELAALCIYAVQTDEPINDAGLVLKGDALKLCTFKVGEAVRGRKVGELFLRAAFQYATNHRCEHIFITAQDQHEQLKDLLADFGFYQAGTQGLDVVYVKDHPLEPPAVDMEPFEYVKRFYPHYLDRDVQKFLVPVQPQYHQILFPDFTDAALPPAHPQRHVGNAMKLAYLCHTPSKQPRKGDIFLFYRSRDLRAVTSLGVVESYQWSTSPDEIARIVSRRTVYTDVEIEEMAARETKVMLFRLVHHFKTVVPYNALKRMRVVTGPIQSITKISDESFHKIRQFSER